MHSPQRRGIPHAVVMMLLIIVAAIGLTWVIPAGRFQRDKAGVVDPASFHNIPKTYGIGIARPAASTDTAAYPAHPVAALTSIPAGMARSAALIFMILFIGGMFGVLQAT